ncbi:helix-turn-helix domain-containing protein [Nocardia pseudobrasiliensis]|uniref:helix-turn-helix domain-containing protein n=1 Tax=Nocardia pseudobrasiliensis TaxID=45979 RepID=UPI0035A237A5
MRRRSRKRERIRPGTWHIRNSAEPENRSGPGFRRARFQWTWQELTRTGPICSKTSLNCDNVSRKADHIGQHDPTEARLAAGRSSRKKQLTPEETAAIAAKYEAGASIAQLRVEHHMAKRTVAKALREAGVTIRPRGGQYR